MLGASMPNTVVSSSKVPSSFTPSASGREGLDFARRISQRLQEPPSLEPFGQKIARSDVGIKTQTIMAAKRCIWECCDMLGHFMSFRRLVGCNRRHATDRDSTRLCDTSSRILCGELFACARHLIDYPRPSKVNTLSVSY
jgi:hypothetical protein